MPSYTQCAQARGAAHGAGALASRLDFVGYHRCVEEGRPHEPRCPVFRPALRHEYARAVIATQNSGTREPGCAAVACALRICPRCKTSLAVHCFDYVSCRARCRCVDSLPCRRAPGAPTPPRCSRRLHCGDSVCSTSRPGSRHTPRRRALTTCVHGALRVLWLSRAACGPANSLACGRRHCVHLRAAFRAVRLTLTALHSLAIADMQIPGASESALAGLEAHIPSGASLPPSLP